MTAKTDIESGAIPDKDYLYGRFERTERWRDKLYRKLAHKSLDIGDNDDMQVTNTRTGMGWKELAVIAASLLGAGHLYLGSQQTPEPSQATPLPAAAPLNDSDYEVRFWDANGNPIDVPHISKRQGSE